MINKSKQVLVNMYSKQIVAFRMDLDNVPDELRDEVKKMVLKQAPWFEDIFKTDKEDDQNDATDRI